MRWIFVWTALFCAMASATAQRISPIITLQNGREVTSEYAFLSGDVCTFRLEDGQAKGEWSISIFDNDVEEPVIRLKTEEATDAFVVPIDSIDWYGAATFDVPGDSSAYFKGMVHVVLENGKEDSIPVRFDLLPLEPEIVGASFVYTQYNWEYDDFLHNAEFSIYFRSERCDKYILESGDSYFFEFPQHDYRRYFFTKEFGNLYKGVDSILIVRTTSTDWGQFYRLIVGNKYGWRAANDTLCTTDYITDPKILARLEELEREYTSVVPNMIEESFRICRQGDVVKVIGSEGLVSELVVSSYSGVVVKRVVNNSSIDISDLPGGFYIALCRIKDNRVLTYKFLKQ